ncbi:hypothetical protein NG726_37615, partial [Pseudomonas sp. MOB-449]|nr:hypothetical protein [Pseudomonas sp. MOB-449]
LKCHIRDLKASTCALKESLISCSNRAKIAENQTQSLTVKVAELHLQLNCKPQALTGKKWDPETWDWGHMGR